MGHNSWMTAFYGTGGACARAIASGAIALALTFVTSCSGQGCGADCGAKIEVETLERCAVTDQDEKVIEAPPATWATRASQPPLDAVLLEVTPGTVSVERGAGVPLDQLATQLAGAWGQTDANKPGTWALAIAGSVPRADVAAVLKTLADSGHAKGYVMLASGPSVTKADKASSPYLDVLKEVDKVISATPAEERSAALQAEIEKRAPACLSIEEIKTVLLADELHRDCRRLARELSERLDKCGCPKNSGALAALMTIVSEAKLPSVSAPASINAAAKALEGATWADIIANANEAQLGSLWVDAG